MTMHKLTAAQLIRRAILLSVEEDVPAVKDMSLIFGDEIDEEYEKVMGGPDSDFLSQAEQEFRGGYDCETGLPCDSSRHYESKSVAKCLGGVWVGWVYWYGGGKHGEPSSIDWMSEAYLLDVTEEEKLVTVRTFKKSRKEKA